MILGLTGKCCAGKDEAARILAERGWRIIDVDALGHRALSLRKRDVAERFGWEVVGPGGEIDRSRLGRMVFSDPAELEALEEIVHPEMKRMVREEVEKDRKRGGHTVVNAALLFTMGLHSLCDAVIRVSAPAVLRFLRAKRRDGLSMRDILRRFAGQRELFPKHLMQDVDMYTVRNCGTRTRLERNLARTLNRIDREPAERGEA
jgi:dephospho-CoA kinase